MKTSWWPGPSFLFEFKNGTKKNYETLATTDYLDFDIRNGTALYDRACQSQSKATSKPSAMMKSLADKPGYPKTKMQSNDTTTSGYFSNKDSLRDTAILSVPTFLVAPDALSLFVKGFLEKATEQGKNKLLIDLTGNPGGILNAGFGLFSEIFPGKEMYLGTRFRSHEAADSLGRVLSHMSNSSTLNVGLKEANPYIPQLQVTPDQNNDFESWEDLYGPHKVLNTDMSSLFASFNFTAASKKESPLNGYGNIPLSPKTPPFAPEDITLVSTCNP